MINVNLLILLNCIKRTTITVTSVKHQLVVQILLLIFLSFFQEIDYINLNTLITKR